MRRLILTVMSLGFMIAGCARRPANFSNATLEAAPAAPRIIVELVGRDETVQVFAGADGPRHSVFIGDRVVTSNVSAEQLRIAHPAIYQRLRESYALPGGAFDYAGLSVPSRFD